MQLILSGYLFVIIQGKAHQQISSQASFVESVEY